MSTLSEMEGSERNKTQEINQQMIVEQVEAVIRDMSISTNNDFQQTHKTSSS
jgi:hypothetical protein